MAVGQEHQPSPRPQDPGRFWQPSLGVAPGRDAVLADVARIETETERVRVEVMNAEADVIDAAGELATLLGFPGWSPRATGDLAPDASVPRAWNC